MRSPIWRMRKLSDASSRDLAAPTEDRGGVPALLRLLHRLDHEALHVGEALEVRVEDLGRLVRGDAEALAEPVGLHAVGEAVVHDLGEAALRVVDLRPRSTPNTFAAVVGVHVGAALERVDQAGILGEVREHPQLDLRVVGGEEPPAVVGDERLAHLAAVGGAHRHVLEVRRLARDPSGRGVGLLERRVDAPVGGDRAAGARRRRCCAASRPRGSAGGPRRSDARRPSSAASRRRSTARSSSSSPARARASRTGSCAAAAWSSR